MDKANEVGEEKERRMEFMLGKGAKRKLEEDEDGLEGKALALGGAVMADGPSKVSYTLQRQTIFNISLMKLYNQRALTEPSLERRVLINNMLRRIQEELKQEGGPRPLLFPPSAAPPNDPVDEGFCEAQPAFGVLSTAVAACPPPQPLAAPPTGPQPLLPLSGSAPPDSCLTPASLLEDDASSFCTSPSPHQAYHHQLHGLPRSPSPSLAKDSFSTALDEIEELCPSVTMTTTTSSFTVVAPNLSPLTSPLPLSTGLDSKDCSKNCSQKFEGLVSQLESRAGVATIAESRLMDGLDMSSSCSSGFLTDLALDDILFADIDTSMYDFDPCTTAAGTTTSKMAPVVTADDLLKTLSPYGGSPATVTPSQPFKMDLTELDHIMEVLLATRLHNPQIGSLLPLLDGMWNGRPQLRTRPHAGWRAGGRCQSGTGSEVSSGASVVGNISTLACIKDRSGSAAITLDASSLRFSCCLGFLSYRRPET
ncbi:hypothetical protein JZ751_010871 [Albula glossodonta]|uniref:SERTA domain-containing protein n=1 Tax=Albula glossodonta TaxID=121402 RepID=A0A8T2P3K4_9TELE|nr:hypothetical protein JZ751_010871 [Albula glossodonta]